ncbi:uncharacterized protein LOC129912660 isoform X2 [Episyrphus balteatus]|uniref:uncharacterized protein LOC129912660 isoform X2 n=1 Tax=Episyrphus balteatus TaxID=286459 RepID=UPI0024856F8A|nr:uncharacterized protein LOC129912660 isoform X2 [Episyrphus balteatus]
MEIKMPANNEKSKTVLLFHISHSLFKNKRLKRRRLASKIKKKIPKKRSKPKQPQQKKPNFVNGGLPSSPNLAALFSNETIEIISTDDEEQQEEDRQQPSPNTTFPEIGNSLVLSANKTIPEVETSIVLSSGDEDEVATQARIFPMLTNQTTVQTEVGNAVFELSLTQLKENLQTITKKRKKHRESSKRLSKRLTMTNSNLSADLSISLLSDDEDDQGENTAARQ